MRNQIAVLTVRIEVLKAEKLAIEKAFAYRTDRWLVLKNQIPLLGKTLKAWQREQQLEDSHI